MEVLFSFWCAMKFAWGSTVGSCKMKTMLVFSLPTLYNEINLNWSDLYALR